MFEVKKNKWHSFFGAKFFLDRKIFRVKKVFEVKKMLGHNFCASKKILGQTIFGVKKLL